MDIAKLKQFGISSKAILDYYKEFDRIGGENHGLIISVEGQRVYEEYCPPYTKDTPQNMFSVTKCLVSIGIAFAIQDGLISLDTKILPYFKDYPHTDDPEYDDVTVEALLLMNSNKKFSFLQDMTADHAELFMKAPFRKNKGFQYSNNDSHILAALLDRVTGKRLDDYLDEKLFKPLGLKKPFWERNKKGVCVGGSGVFLTLNDLATIGQCVADEGMWNGVQVIPRDYITTAVKKHTTPTKTYHADGFGYYFWQDGQTYRLEGLFGQFSVIIPSKKTVVTLTSMHPSDNLIAKTIQNVLIAHLFDQTDDVGDQLQNYLNDRVAKMSPIKTDREPRIEASVNNRTYKRKGIITSLTKAFTQFNNGLIPNAIHSSYPDRPDDSFDYFSFEFKNKEVIVSWKEGDDVTVKFSSGLDGVASVTSVDIRQWTYSVYSYGYWQNGKLHIVTRALNTISAKEFIFTFKGNKLKVKVVCKPDFSIFCGFNSVAGGTFPSLPVITPILVGILKGALIITKIPVKFKGLKK